MKERPTSVHTLRFGVFELDLSAGELRKQGLKIRLQDQPFQVLAKLLENPGGVVTREDLRERLWPGDTFVDFDHSLNNCVNKLREALDDSAANPRFIETLPRRGYRFIAPVEVIAVRSTTTELAADSLAAEVEPVGGRATFSRYAVVLVGFLAAFAAGLAVWNHGGWRPLLGRQGDLEPIRSLAVLPLENFSGDPTQTYLADSMTDQLITDLAGIKALRVTSRTSVMRFRGTQRDLRDISSELNVDAIVEGSVIRLGSNVRITAQLIHAASDRHLWAQTYEGNLADVLSLQRKAALDIARQIQVQLTPQEKVRLTKSRTIDLEAQEAYFQGRYYWNTKRTKEGLQKAVGFFQKAIAREPNYAQAYSGMADSFVLLGSRAFLPPKEAFARAKAEANKALALDDTLAEAHAAPAFAGLYYDWEWANAELEFRRAIELNPSYTNAYHWYSHFLIAMGRFDESLVKSMRCIELDPLDPGMVVHLGEHYLFARQNDLAIEQLLKAIQMDSNRYRAHDNLGRAYEQKGMYALALAEFDRAVATSQEGSAMVASRAAGYAAGGRRDEALRIVNRLKSESRHTYVPAYGLAEIFAVLGDKDEAFAWLDKAYEERSSALAYLKVEPRLDRLRADERFRDLLRRMRL